MGNIFMRAFLRCLVAEVHFLDTKDVTVRRSFYGVVKPFSINRKYNKALLADVDRWEGGMR